jgi:hypothetical protein
VPALDEVQADIWRGAVKRLLHLSPVSGGADLRIVRRQHDGDHPVGTAFHDLVDRGGDPRHPVLHPEVHGVDHVVGRVEVQLPLERAPELDRDRQQRGRDANPPVA